MFVTVFNANFFVHYKNCKRAAVSVGFVTASSQGFQTTLKLDATVSFSVARFAREKIQPLVSKMDQNSEMDESIISGMFEQGVSSITTSLS